MSKRRQEFEDDRVARGFASPSIHHIVNSLPAIVETLRSAGYPAGTVEFFTGAKYICADFDHDGVRFDEYDRRVASPSLIVHTPMMDDATMIVVIDEIKVLFEAVYKHVETTMEADEHGWIELHFRC